MSGNRDAVQQEQVTNLARSVVEGLPPERLDPRELEDFDANAAAWARELANAAPGRDGACGFGPDSVMPEATQLALMAAQSAIQVMVEGGMRGWWDRRRQRKRERLVPATTAEAPLSAAQVAKVHAVVVAALVGTGVSKQTAELFAGTIITTLNQTSDEPAAT